MDLVFLIGSLCVAWTTFEIARLLVPLWARTPNRPRAWNSNGDEIPIEVVDNAAPSIVRRDRSRFEPHPRR